MRVVVDTNILVSALMRPDSPPGQVMAAVKRGELVPVFSASCFAEYEDVLQRPRLRLVTITLGPQQSVRGRSGCRSPGKAAH
jgi:uncharacterized protein